MPNALFNKMESETMAESEPAEEMAFSQPESAPTADEQKELDEFLKAFEADALSCELLDMHAVVDFKAET